MTKGQLKNIIKEAISEVLNESGNDTADLISKISIMTDHNNHIEAMVELAKFLNNKTYLEITKAMFTIQDNDRDAATFLSKYKNEVLNRMLSDFKKKYGNDSFNRLHDVF